MAENRNIPEIRFEGFSGSWGQRKLSEIATMHARIGWQNLRKSEFLDSGDYYLITGTDFDDGKVDLANCHYVTKDRYDQDTYIQIENGSILITKDGTLGKVAYVKGLEKPATLNAGVFNVLIRDKKRVYGKYLFQYLKAPFLLDYVAQRATGGTIKHLNQEILVDFPVVLPEHKEQVLLGDAFEEIDNLIALYARKHEQLKNIKMSMLEKMFPRKGANVPEIRFAGFSDAWEQRKLGDEAIEMVAGGDIDKSLLDEHGNYPVIANALIDDGIVGYYASDYRIKAPAVTVTGRGDVGHAKARTVNFTPIVRLLSVRSKHDVFFLENAINTLNVIIESTGVPQLTVPQLSQCEIYFPPTITEEKKIGAFFDRVDNLIALHRHKYEKLKQIKKSILEKMLV